MERKGKNLIPTKAGVNLVTVLPELQTSPKLTADWEQRLNEVAKGQASPEDFMDGIEAMAAELVRKYSHISEDGQKLFQPEKETVGLCPRCGKPVYEGKKNFACSDRACQFVIGKAAQPPEVRFVIVGRDDKVSARRTAALTAGRDLEVCLAPLGLHRQLQAQSGDGQHPQILPLNA